jgi:hypothetical protein
MSAPTAKLLVILACFILISCLICQKRYSFAEEKITEDNDMLQQKIIEALEKMEKEDFLSSTNIASGHATVANILGDTAEFHLLLDNKDTSLPLLRARYRSNADKMADSARLAYFVVIGLARDKEMMSEVISYLKRTLNIDRSTILSPWHPFMHGMHALEKITGGAIRSPDSGGTTKDFDRFLDQVADWAKADNK